MIYQHFVKCMSSEKIGDQTVITKVGFAMRPVPLDMQMQMQIMKAPITLQHDFLGVVSSCFFYMDVSDFAKAQSSGFATSGLCVWSSSRRKSQLPQCLS